MREFIVLMGAPGAGKGTQAKMLEQALGMPQVSTGEIFRHNLKNMTELGKQVQAYYDKGELVPDDVTIAMVRDRLAQPDSAKGAILDGFPRTPAQAAALDQLLTEVDGRVLVVPFVKVDSDVLMQRLVKRAEIEGRVDDTEETVRNRMRVYEAQTEPLLDYYRQRGLLVEINGQQSIEDVQADLQALVARKSA